jgi:hypothetical protein
MNPQWDDLSVTLGIVTAEILRSFRSLAATSTPQDDRLARPLATTSTPQDDKNDA